MSTDAPIPMLLWCPECRARHVDVGEFAIKPHHTHACQNCGHVWRPAIVPTCGVQFLPGFKNPASDGVRCENAGCTNTPVHGEHFYDKKRWWCDLHVPMSGHYEDCPFPCRKMVREVTDPEEFKLLAARHPHLRS